jgi:hypothetical protein
MVQQPYPMKYRTLGYEIFDGWNEAMEEVYKGALYWEPFNLFSEEEFFP